MSQLGLFEDGATRLAREGFAAPARLELDAGAWIEHQPGWLAGHGELFDTLRLEMEWHVERRAMYDSVIEVPRLTATIPDDGPCPPALAYAHDALERRYRRRFESIRLAWYRDGRDSVAMHGDRIGRRIADTVVAILSLGVSAAFSPQTRGGRAIASVRPRRRRPAGHGRRVPTHVAPRHTEGGIGRAADQHPVSRATRRCLIAGDATVSHGDNLDARPLGVRLRARSSGDPILHFANGGSHGFRAGSGGSGRVRTTIAASRMHRGGS